MFRTAEIWVVDFGLLAYSENPPPAFATLEAAVTGDVYLGVDPFFYFERLCRLPGMPELRYDWQINSILLETTPWISGSDASGREVRQRDESRISYRQVERTDA